MAEADSNSDASDSFFDSSPSPPRASRAESSSQAQHRQAQMSKLDPRQQPSQQLLSTATSSSAARGPTSFHQSQDSDLRFLSPLPSSPHGDDRRLYPGPFSSPPSPRAFSPLSSQSATLRQPPSSPTRDQPHLSPQPERRVPASTWRSWTESDRLVHTALERARAQDLAIHLYNAFALQRHANPSRTSDRNTRADSRSRTRSRSGDQGKAQRRQSESNVRARKSNAKGKGKEKERVGADLNPEIDPNTTAVVFPPREISCTTLSDARVKEPNKIVATRLVTAITFDPPRRWSAWPLPPHEVPRESLIPSTLLGGPAGDQSYKKKPDTRPSAELEECLIAVMARAAKDRWEARDWESSETEDENQERARVKPTETHQTNARKRRRETGTEVEAEAVARDHIDPASRSEAVASRSRRRRPKTSTQSMSGTPEREEGSQSPHIETDDSNDGVSEEADTNSATESDSLPQSPTPSPPPPTDQTSTNPSNSKPAYQIFSSNVFASPSPSSPSSLLSLSSPSLSDAFPSSKVTRPVFLADDDNLHHLLLPGTRHVISQLDKFLSALHRIQLNNSSQKSGGRRHKRQRRRRQQQQQRDEEAAAAEESDEGDRNVGSRGVREVMDIAGLCFSTVAVEKARERCVRLGLMDVEKEA